MLSAGRCGLMSCLPLLLVVGACGERQSGSDAILPAVRLSPATDQDKRAARVLSIGNVGIGDLPQDAYRQALLCRDTASDLLARLHQAGALNAEQERAMETVRSHYARKTRALAGTAPKSGAAQQQDSETQTDVSSKARLLMACVQRMEQGG